MDLLLALKAALLGVVEGLTEFIPVSSTGHLIVASNLLGFDHPVRDVFEIVIQMGAILAVVWYFRARLLLRVRGLFNDPACQRFWLNLGVAFIPFAAVGFLFGKTLKHYLFNPATVAIALCLGGVAILIIERLPKREVHREAEALPVRTALAVGLCQILALVPGVSRSGATIMGGLCLGLSRSAATEFSFFLSIPVLSAASVYDLYKHRQEITSEGYELILIGFVVSFIVGLAVVHWLLKFVAKHSFVVFGWYRLGAGLVLALAIALGWIQATRF
jgi:undecaprenyl-diphosphatase